MALKLTTPVFHTSALRRLPSLTGDVVTIYKSANSRRASCRIWSAWVTARPFSTSDKREERFEVVVVGGGAGGCSTAAYFCRKLGQGKVCVVEPKEMHAYQSLWTLVGAGLKKMSQSQKPMSSVLPSGCVWVKDTAAMFEPDNNLVVTTEGKRLEYKYLILAAGIQLNFHKVKGLVEALETDPMVVSNYSAKYVTKTFPALQALKSGNAAFTYPNTPIKCAGAPQKIMYLADEIFRKRRVRDNIDVTYYTSLPVIFGVQKYANSLLKVVERQHLSVRYRHNLLEVKPDTREAVFQQLDSDQGQTITVKYDFLHATPPQSAPDALRNSVLVNPDGWVDVDRETLQHVRYSNVFGLGDCTSLPTSKTCAATAAQFGVLTRNLSAVMQGTVLPRSYTGYASCPLVTGRNKCILAEFDYTLQPMETFPFDQGQERSSMYQLKAHVMPHIYWQGLLKGVYEGPEPYRKVMHLGMAG